MPAWPAPGGFSPVRGMREATTERIELKATKSELDALTHKANEGGYRTAQELVIDVIRAFLSLAPVVDPEAAAAIGRTNLSLIRIGANLNQMAKVLNGWGDLSAAEAQAFKETALAIELHTREIAGLLGVARGRWLLTKKEGVQDVKN